MRLKDWSDKQGVSYTTAWRWFKSGKLPVRAYKTPSGMILVEEATFPLETTSNQVWVYTRVSSNEKKEDLNRQAERCVAFCQSRGWEVQTVVKEVASGMNDNRPKFWKLLNSNPTRIVVEHKDRLTRFGFKYLENLLPKLGCELVVMNRDSEAEDDLIKDLVAIVTSFCCRLYGLRRGHAKAKAFKEVLL